MPKLKIKSMQHGVLDGEKGAKIDGGLVGEHVVLMHHSRFVRAVSGIEFTSDSRAIDAAMSTPSRTPLPENTGLGSNK